MNRTILYGLLNGIGLSLLLFIRTSISSEFLNSNSAILNLLITALCIYIAIAAFINGKNSKDYNYAKGFGIGIGVSAIGVILSLAILYFRVTILFGHEMTSLGQAMAYFLSSIVISALIPLMFLRATKGPQ